MLSEWPLILFTTLGQTGAGLALFAGIHTLCGGEDDGLALKPGLQFLLAALIMGLGFGFAALHLGSPDRMFNSMARLGSSALSQEGLAGMLAAGLCAVAGISGLKGRVNTGLAGGALGLCLVFVFTMARIYASMDTVPTWNTPVTHVSFFGAAIFTGAALSGLLGKSQGPARGSVILGVVWGGILLLAVLPLQAQSAVGWVNELGAINCLAACSGAAIVLGVAGGVLGQYRSRVRLSAFALAWVGVLLARTLFYGLHTTLIMH